MTDETIASQSDDQDDSIAPGRSDDYLAGTEWMFWHAVAVTFAFLMSAVIAIVILAAITGRGLGDFTANEQLGVLGPIQFLGGLLALFVLMLAHKHANPRRAYGFRLRPRDWWAFFAGIGLQIGAGVILIVLALIFFPDSDPPQQTAADLAGNLSGWGIALGFLTIVVLAPIYEEIVFRAIVLSRLLRLMQAWPAYLLNGLLFAGIHVLFDANAWFASIALFPLGTALACMAHRGGSLSRPILAHMGVNTLGAIGIFFGDDLQRWANDLQDSIEAAIRFAGLT